MIQATNPYVGPRAFRIGEELYGRDREARELVDLLIAERIVLLYSPSGAGKTSIIQASVITAMSDEDYQVLPVVRPGLIEGAERDETTGNLFVSRVIAGCEEGRPKGEALLSNTPGITLAGYLTQRSWIQEDTRLKLLIFDQFEEVLNSVESEEAKLTFFQQLGDALRYQQIWILIAMREEYSAALDGYRHLLPTRLSTRFRLDLLSRTKAEEAIRIPAGLAGVEFHASAAKRLLDELSTIHERTSDGTDITRQVGFVEPLYLQIVCKRLWEQLPQGTRQISPEQLEGGTGSSEVEQSLEHHYDGAISEVSEKTQITPRAIREWLERELITPQGLRRQVPKGEKETAGLTNKVVEELAEHSLVRSDSRAGTIWYEITHDRLAAVILSGNTKWFGRSLEPFQVRAASWDRLRRAGAEQATDAELLKGEGLKKAQDWKKQNPGAALTDVDRRYLKHCEKAWDRGKLERKARWGFLWVIIPSVLLAGWIMAYMEKKATKSEKEQMAAIIDHNRQLKAQRAEEHARILLSAAATNKWRNHNHELASLLALHAHRLTERHGKEESGVGAWGEEMLRIALQSRPFVFSQKLGGRQTGIVEEKLALSGSLALATVKKNAQELDVISLAAPLQTERTMKLDTPLTDADFDRKDHYLVALGEGGATLYPVSDDARDPILIDTESSPAGPFCVSPDGRSLAIATGSSQIEVWLLSPNAGSAERSKTLTSAQLRIPTGMTISALACSENNTWLAWGTPTGQIGYVDVSGEIPRLLWLAANDFDNWPDVLKRDLGSRKNVLDYGVAALRYLPSRRWLLVFYRQGPPRVFDLATPLDEPRSAYFLPNDYSEAVLRVEQEQGRAIRRVANRTRVLRVDVSPDERKVVLGGARSLLGEWDLETFSRLPRSSAQNPESLLRLDGNTITVYGAYREYSGLQSTVMALRYIPEDNGAEFTRSKQTQPLIAAIDAALEMRVWSNEGLTNAGYLVHYPNDPGIIYALAFLDRSGNRLAYGGSRTSGVLRIQETDQSVVNDDSIVLPDGIRALAVDRGFERLVISTRCNEFAGRCTQPSSWVLELRQGNISSHAPLPKDIHTDGQWAAAIDPAGRALLTGGWDKRAVVWRQHDKGIETRAWEAPVLLSESPDTDLGHPSAVLSAAIRPKAGDIATGTKDGAIYVWRESASGGWSVDRLLNIGIKIHALAYSPAGDHLMAGDDDGFLWVWDIEEDGTYSRHARISAHQGAVFAIEFGLNNTFATGGSDGVVYLWTGDPKDRRRLRLGGPLGEVMSLALSATGDLLAAGDATGAIHIWEIGRDKLIEQACSKMRRNLSWQEWKTYMREYEYECTCPSLPPGHGVSTEQLSKEHWCKTLAGES